MKSREEMSKEVDRVAFLMCEELGLDPFQGATYQINDGVAPHEGGEMVFTHQPPLVGSPPYEDMNAAFTYGDRWKSFRRQAGLAIAGWKAVHKFMLTEAGSEASKT